MRLEERLGLIWSAADGLGHFFGGRREIAFVRVHARQCQMAHPVVRVFLGDLLIQRDRALGVAVALERAGVDLELNVGGLA